ncbi:MAG: hypothetical protein ACTJLL_02535 [Anaplasma sp.]
MIYFDNDSLREAFSNGGIYVHSDPYWGHRFVDGQIEDGMFSIDHLSPINFRSDRESGVISFERVPHSVLSYLDENTYDKNVPEFNTYGAFKYKDQELAELLHITYSEHTYGAAKEGEPSPISPSVAMKNGFSVFSSDTEGVVAFDGKTVVFQAPTQEGQVLDVILYLPPNMTSQEMAQPNAADEGEETHDSTDLPGDDHHVQGDWDMPAYVPQYAAEQMSDGDESAEDVPAENDQGIFCTWRDGAAQWVKDLTAWVCQDS